MSRIPIKEQDEILDCENKNLIISASAGSGKTTVMIAKILKYVLTKSCHVDELLVLTYTKSAASEMKKKLIDKLKENLESMPELSDELDLVPTADISTFDSFCQKLVKKYFYILNIDPSFKILEGGDQNYEQGKALNNALKQLKLENPSCYELLLNNFSPKRDEEKLKQIILEIYAYTTSLLDNNEFVEKSEKLYNKSEKIAENYLISYYFGIFSQIKHNLEQLQKKCSLLEFQSYVEYINNLLSIIDSFLLEKSFNKKIDSLSDINYKTLRKEKDDDSNIKNIIAKEKDKLKKLIDSIKLNFKSSFEIEKSYDFCSKIVRALFELLNLFITHYSLVKTSLNSYDFDDIERLTIKLLENEPIRQEIKSCYKHIFVDEFQDANAVQEKIISMLESNNLFFVGDTKQSIYAFRKSDPEIFLNIEKKFDKDNNSESKRLNCNFRTNKNILDFANLVFNKIMTEKTAGIDYYNKAQFDAKAPYIDLENEICVSINVINKQKTEEKQIPTKVYSLKDATFVGDSNESSQDQCLFVANQILENLGKEIYDKDLQQTKKIALSDITILLSRRGSFLNSLTKCLTEIGIPYIIGSNDNLEETYDNMVLFNLIKLAQNSKDDYALYSVLSSALYNFTNDELSEIKNENSETIYFYEALSLYAQKNNPLSEKIQKFYNSLNNFYFNAKYKGLYYALNDILINTNYLLTISFEDDFQNRKINIDQYIDSFCGSKYNNDICGYILYRETAIRQDKIQTSINTLDAVNITTMHSSKGLEYPVVILPNLNDDFFKGPANNNEIKINKHLGLGIKAYDDNDRTISTGIFYESCRLKNKEQELSERIRLLYVAITRAKNKLIICGYNSKNYYAFKDDYEIMSCHNYLGLVMGALDENLLNKINNEECFSTNINDNSKILLNCLNIEKQDLAYKNVLIPKKSDEYAINVLSEFLQKDFINQIKPIALKNSVSSLSHDENASQNFAPKNFELSEHLSENTNKLGTLYHKVLEDIEFNNTNSESDVKQFIECNFSLNQIEQLKNIGYNNIFKNIELIKTFITSDSQLLKEQKFVMNINYNEVVNSSINDKILIQGIIDLLIIKENEIILVDYKLSSKTNQIIKERYKQQLFLYELAIKKWFKDKQIKKYIINLSKNQIIKMD